MVVFLVEEVSMADFLEELLPRLVPGLAFLCVSHDGKSDLEKSLATKLRSWKTPHVRFVVLRDQDSEDCHAVKEKLNDLCARGSRPDSLARVVCRELEAWYVGDVDALAEAYPDAARRIRTGLGKQRFRDPDNVAQPAKALAQLIPTFQKRIAARAMGKLLSRDNRSRSYQVFLAGVDRLYADNNAEATP